jgi:diguanylate cyclase (GGDEF)-like protein
MASIAAFVPSRVLTTRQRRLFGDPHVLLGVAIALSATIIEAVEPGQSAVLVALAGVAYVCLQIVVASRRGLRHPMPRLLIALGFLSGLAFMGGPAHAVPLTLLALPIVATAARYGRREAIVVGIAAVSLPLIATMAGAEQAPVVLARGSAFLATLLLLAIGSRLTVEAMESAVTRARTSMSRERRRNRQMAGVEAVGRILATDPSPASLDKVMDLLVRRFGYSLVSIYLKDADGSLVLGAQRGYDRVLERFDGSSGIVGRVMRTGMVQLIPDVTRDPDYRSANDDVRSEIGAPLFAGGDLIGVLNVEDPRVGGLDETDRSTLVLVAERLAGAIALGRDRLAITERAARFAALAEFARRINGSLDPREVYPLICDAVCAVIPSDVVVLTLLDGTIGDYRIAALTGPDQRYVGVRILEGEGMAGVAIAERRLVVDDHFDRERYPTTMRPVESDAAVATLAVPLLRDQDVIGAMTFVRTDLTKPYTALDLEVAPIVAGQVAMAVANAQLHTQVADAAVHDPLTGLSNRRHLDASLERLTASRERLAPEDRRPLSAILFDLDHFGAFNKRHGHKVGDAVLRTFGSMLTGRFRASDIVARYGGEEFLVVLDGATLDEARRVAEDVRAAFAATTIDAPSGPLKATVSAGCSALGPSVSSVGLLLEVADVALQMAKRGGRNQVVAA